MAAVMETAQATGSLQARRGCIERSGGQHLPSSRTLYTESWPAPAPPWVGRDEAGASEAHTTRAGRHESRDRREALRRPSRRREREKAAPASMWARGLGLP